jgi:hypothetical protein
MPSSRTRTAPNEAWFADERLRAHDVPPGWEDRQRFAPCEMLLSHQTIAVPHRPDCSPRCARRPALGIGQRGPEKDSAESRADRTPRARAPPDPNRREHVHRHPVPDRAPCRSLQVGPVQIQGPSVLPRVGHTGHLASSAGGTQAGSTGPCPPVREELTTRRPPRTQRRTYGPQAKRDLICIPIHAPSVRQSRCVRS